jgi:hypothetical protein
MEMTFEEKILKAFDGNVEAVIGGVGVHTSQFIQDVLTICKHEAKDVNTKLEIAKEMCNKIIRHWEVDRIFVKDPFQECYELAKETLSKLLVELPEEKDKK